MDKKLGFIGAGTIGEAIIKAIVKSGFIPACNIYASDVNREKLEMLREETGINIAADNRELVGRVDAVLVAVKPQVVRSVLEEIKSSFGNKILITIAAGIPMKLFTSILGYNIRIFRAMPNLPLLVGEGMTVLTYRPGASNEDLDFTRSLFEKVGRVEILDESLLSDVISLTGSSPAYVFIFIESIAASAVKIGLPMNLAYRIAAQSVLGSAKLLLQENVDLDTQENELSRILGQDADIYNAFNREKVRKALLKAMEACNKRSHEFERI